MAEQKFLPRRISSSKIFDVLVAYLNAGGDREYVGIGDVEEKSSVGLHNISRNNNFLKSWGFLEESEREAGRYRLTDEAAQFASAYRINPEGEETKSILRGILSKDETLMKFVERIRRESLSRETVLIQLPRVVGDLRADKVGINAFIDMIAYAFNIEGLMESRRVSVRAVKPPTKRRRRVTVKSEVGSIEMPSQSPASISITLSISPEISPERLKEYIKAILEAYKEYGE